MSADILFPVGGGVVGFLVAQAVQNEARIRQFKRDVRDVMDHIASVEKRADKTEHRVYWANDRVMSLEHGEAGLDIRLRRVEADAEPLPAATRLRRARRIRPPRP